MAAVSAPPLDFPAAGLAWVGSLEQMGHEADRTGSGSCALASGCWLEHAGKERVDNLAKWRSLKPNNCGCSSDCDARANSQSRSTSSAAGLTFPR
jgi:hypothetical protein